MVELETLLTSIASSVQTSQAAIQLNAYKHFMKYFTASTKNGGIESGERKPAPTHFPLTQYFNVSDSSTNTNVAVPAVALVNHDSLVLENVKVVLNVSGVCDGEHFMVSTEPINDSQGVQHHQITLDFKQKEPSEGISRILTAYNQFL